MKVIVNLLKFILITILTICMISIGIITIMFSTLFDKNYVVQKLEETDFYSGTYKLVESNFENYIYQSGLDEQVLQGICTQEKVEKDIDIMLSNIYVGTDQKIDTKEIADNLNTNIDKLGIKTKQNEDAINKFVEHICNEYTDTLIHSQYEQKINNVYVKLTEKLNEIYNIAFMMLVVSFIAILIANRKKFSKDIQYLVIAMLATSAFQLISYQIVQAKVNIQGIKIFNDVFSNSIVTIIQDVLSKINSIALGTFVIALLLNSICVAIIVNKKTKENSEAERKR